MIQVTLISPSSTLSQLYKILLGQESIPFSHAKTTENATNLIKNKQPEIVVIDSDIESEPYELIGFLRDQKWGQDCSIIYLTDFDPEPFFVKTKQLKVSGAFDKSKTRPSEIIAKIKELI